MDSELRNADRRIALNIYRVKRRTRSVLGEKPDGTGDQLLVLCRNEYQHRSSYPLREMDRAFQPKPPTYEVP